MKGGRYIGIVGNYRGFLKLKTNYPEKPKITIWIRARFTKSVLQD